MSDILHIQNNIKGNLKKRECSDFTNKNGVFEWELI